MKQTLHIIAYAAVALALLSSCAKEEFKENAIPAGEPIEVSLNGLIGEFTPADATKATAESVVRVTWGSGDKVYVYDGGNASIGTLTVTPDNNNASYAMLSGTITASTASPAPSKLTLVYVKGATEAPTIAGGKISVDLSSQNQTEVPFVLYTTVAYDAAALTKTNEYISFTFATSVMTVNCTGLQTGASGAVTGIDKAEIDGVSTACELTVDGSGVTAVAGTTPGTITRTGTSVFTQSDSRGAFRLALAADPAAPAARNILVFQGSKVSGAAFTPTTLAEGKLYNTVYQMDEYVSNAPDGMLSGEFTVSDPDGIPNSGDETKVHFSKGNLWYGKVGSAQVATFQFEGKQYEFHTYDSTNDLWGFFGWVGTSSTVFTSVPGIYGVSTSATRSDYGNVAGESLKADWGKTIGDGNTWRTLTQKEWEYLFNKHSYKWVSVNDVVGYVIAPDQVTLSEGKTSYTEAELNDANLVFLPAAGYRGDFMSDSSIDIDGVGREGRYWSSSSNENNEDYADFAKFVCFDNSFVGATAGYNYPRNYGHSVRLVTESAGGYAPAVKVTGVTLGKNETLILVGAKETLVATVAPANATNKQVNWSSSDTSVATVDATSGEVTGVAPGSAVITATTIDGNFTAVCLVTVKALPAGALKGKFSVSATKKVYFSKGNLYAKKESGEWTWHFYDEQYQYNPAATTPGQGGRSRTTTANDTEIDLFTWGYNAANSVNPIGNNNNNVSRSSGNLTQQEDWGSKIGDGTTWRTLTSAEWQYLINKNVDENSRKNKYKYGVTVCEKTNCLVLAPDDWDISSNALQSEYSATSTPMTWEQAEAAGLVCLPAAGCRSGDYVNSVCEYGYYWSSSASDSQYAFGMFFRSDYINPGVSYGDRGNSSSVRLVTECE